MKHARSLLLAASTLALFISACSQPADIQTPNLAPQYGTALEDFGSLVATNEAGQLYTLGSVRDYDNEMQYNMYDEPVLKRFDASGNERWSRKLGVQCNGLNDLCSTLNYGLGTDMAGNSYALYGRSYDIEGSAYDATLKKFSPSGTLLWTRPLYKQFEVNLEDEMTMATSAKGETFVAYRYSNLNDENSSRPTTLHLVKYSTGGQKVFDKPLVIDKPSDAAVAGDGSLYVVGTGEVAKYSSAGAFLWQRALPQVPSSEGEQVAVSGSHVYVSVNTDSGYEATGGKSLIALYKYTGGGAPVWQRSITPANLALMHGLSADASGNVYLSGEKIDGSFNHDLFARKYTPSGGVAWTYTPALPGTLEVANDISAADSGKLYLVGFTDGKVNGKNYGREDAFLIRLDTAGQRVWSR